MAKEKKTKEPKPERVRTAANPLPYIISFAILFIIACILLTWVLDVFNKENECGSNPNMWCTDNFVCTKPCDPSSGKCMTKGVSKDGTPTNLGGEVDPCYCQNIDTTNPVIGVTGIAGCLFSPTGFNASYCNSTANDCDCKLPASTPNCFATCPSNPSEIPKQNCCAKANGQANCPLAPGNVPS